MKRIIECFLFIICDGAFCNAQQTLSATGGEAAGAGGTASYTIGQVTYTTITQSEGSVSQGVQQPYEISVISSSKDNYGIQPELSVCPNPVVSTYLKLTVVNYSTGNLSYQLYDVNGKLLENRKLDGAETNIHMDWLVPSVYFLKVTDDDKEIITFRIVKN